MRPEILFMHEHYNHTAAPSHFLVDNLDLLPIGKALDVAMGAGRHAVFLARHGFTVTGIDISPELVIAAREAAHNAGVHLETMIADLEHGYHVTPGAFDVIVCFNYLHRPLIPEIRRGLRAGGVVVYETFTVDQVQFGRPSNPDFLLKHDELPDLFSGFNVLRYYDTVTKERATAGIIARKPVTGEISLS